MAFDDIRFKLAWGLMPRGNVSRRLHANCTCRHEDSPTSEIGDSGETAGSGTHYTEARQQPAGGAAIQLTEDERWALGCCKANYPDLRVREILTNLCQRFGAKPWRLYAEPAGGATLAALAQKFVTLSRLADDWDGYGANAPNDVALANALERLLEFARDHDLPTRIVADAEGGIAFYFIADDGTHLLVNSCMNDGTCSIGRRDLKKSEAT